ncbi:UDP-N-acetylmuramoyl-tripeptide--D-alanyl-D-alanine ligase [Polaribacter filamentus]|uniref:UDP-N-acetylmuramoyl-tripeptide--D-alanyl-D-alanine ligase n=1 Tax=Polaribacter filamentus TaxID=53483 RepID=A0A2S7KYR6_9FLAO|nr:UDP-N-acetylmuramoyl-tripeptide--D-alanyl-D-alanine ligase [Polaribacter filamentus]PQB07805.1 UDP-N-acetylmuramoyl-tripeptide--D-alanyl-D-alanine ligase [Polaribacter filamentus]
MKTATLYNLYQQHFLVDTDTRNIRKNTIFFALKGDNFNGNTFAEQALKLGASYAVVDEKEFQTNDRILLVTNVLKALQELANFHRKQLHIPIIGLTGSNGKTTTKELIHVVLSKKLNTVATKGNLNNHIGVPLTLLSMTDKTELGIVEMGANHQKEIEFLCTICEPDFGYVTNFGKAHLEGFGGIEGVIKGKSELYTFLKANQKTTFVNADDAIQVKKTKGVKAVSFTTEAIKFLEVNPFVKLSYGNTTIQSNLIGKYNFTNIAAAIAMGTYFKISETAIKEAIESYVPANNRSQILTTKHNTIILDAYNANPSSMQVALENFDTLKAPSKVVILGDMFELGKESVHEHQVIVDVATAFNFDEIYFVGENFNIAKTNKPQFKTYQAFEDFLKKNPLKNSSILIKGSRGMRLERILEFIG